MKLSKQDIYFFSFITIYFILIGSFVLSSDYLLTDEAYFLWHNQEQKTIFNVFNSQGRYLTGILFEFLFRHFDTISKIKWIRFISLCGWACLMPFFFVMVRRCLNSMQVEYCQPLLYSIVAFTTTSLSLTVYISWAACAEIFIASALAVYSGYVLFMKIQLQTSRIDIPTTTWIKVLISGIGSLFLYQSVYPLALIPFLLLFVFAPGRDTNKKLFVFIIFHGLTYVIYYGLYVYALKGGGATASIRTEISLSLGQKLGFFFSFPLNQAFNFNIPFDSGNMISQAMLPALGISWLIAVFVRQRSIAVSEKFNFILLTLIFWLLSFLPELITKETFGPYRTMLPLSLMVFISLLSTLYQMIGSFKRQIILSWTVTVPLVVIGVFNYQHFIAKPLVYEYSRVSQFVKWQVVDGKTGIFVIRPKESGFKASLGITNYKDELGMPSTSKDWVPEPMIKELLFERGMSKTDADKITISQTSADHFSAVTDSIGKAFLIVDIPAILKNP